ncbi:MAG: 3'-5' exonuclease [Acinetobacter sp.]|nr:3'-5' exonuclease [Acinetobacter sp.]
MFDVETGGLDWKTNPITQIAFVVLNGNTMEEVESYCTYVQPYSQGMKYEQKALDFTGITMEMINGGSPAKQVVDHLTTTFKKYRSSRTPNPKYFPVLVGHNASSFDRNFIWNLFKIFGYDLYDYTGKHIEDTQFLTQNAVPDLASVKLINCCEHFGISLEGAHDALNDVRATAEVFKVLTGRLRQSGDEEVTLKAGVEYQRTFKFAF